MANSYEKVLSVISKKPVQRQDFEIQSLLPWLRKKSRLFQELKTDYLKDIVRNCGVKSFKKDEIIIKQGERGDCFYIILAGKISIFIINKDKDAGGGDEMAAFAEIGAKDKEGKLDRSKLGNYATSLGSGIPFGEVALMSDDCIRTATIIAEEPTDLLVVDRALYNRCVCNVLAAEFQEKKDFIDNNPLFKSWMPKYKKQLAMAMYKETWSYDSVLVRQGDSVSNIYFVISGQVEIRTDPVYHPVQYPQFYKLIEDEREKLIKQKKHRPRPDPDAAISQKKRDGSKTLKLCYFGINESLGEIEVLLDMDTYIQTAVCAEKTEVLVLEMKHFERLFVKRHQRTIESMRHNLEHKLNTRTSVLSAKENEDVPLLGLIHMKLNLLHNPPVVTTEKKKKETSVQCAEKLFFNHKGPLLDQDGPGSVFYMIRIREKSKLKFKAHLKDGLKSKQQETGHMHTIRLPHSLVMAAQIAGAKEATDKEVGKTQVKVNEIEIVEKENMPLSPVLNDNKNNKTVTTSQKNTLTPRSFRRIQSASTSKGSTHIDADSLTRHSHNLAEFKSLPSSRPLAHFEKGDQEIRLGMLEEKVKDWLSRDSPKSNANVSKLRRLHVECLDARQTELRKLSAKLTVRLSNLELAKLGVNGRNFPFRNEMETRPRPGNKIVIRRRRKGRHSESSSGTGTASSDVSNEHLAVARATNSMDRYKILLTH